MSNYYLCDTCSTEHWFSDNYSCWICSERDGVRERLVINDGQTPIEVCPYWKAED